MTKSEQLEKLKKEMETANLPLMESNLVFGEGNIDSPVVFIGEAPGRNEAKTGRPFCGRAGDILNELLESADIKRGEIYITNIADKAENSCLCSKKLETVYPKILSRINPIIYINTPTLRILPT